MSSTSKHHHELTNGVGKCSVPMWMGGCPSGFCDKPAYGKRPECKTFYNYAAGERQRFDCKYNGYVPGLACEGHGGPAPMHFGDPCVHCGTPHDEVKPGACTVAPQTSDGQPRAGGMQMSATEGAITRRPARPMDTISGGPIGPSEPVCTEDDGTRDPVYPAQIARSRWPEETAEHRAMRAAFCDGAALPSQDRGCL